MFSEVVRVHYIEGETPRFIKGLLLEETPDFLKIQLQNYVVNISKKAITKWEVER
jgi:hypothetical protein